MMIATDNRMRMKVDWCTHCTKKGEGWENENKKRREKRKETEEKDRKKVDATVARFKRNDR